MVKLTKLVKKSIKTAKDIRGGGFSPLKAVMKTKPEYAEKPTKTVEKKPTKANNNQNKNASSTNPEVKFILEKQWGELQSLEQNTDVNAFRMNGVNVWPVVRYIIWMKLWFISRSLKRAAGFDPFAINIPKHIYDYYKSNGAVNPPDIGVQADYLFYINPNGSDRADIDGNIYNRIIDPIYEKMLNKGMSCMKLCAIRSVSNRAFENYTHQPLYVMPDRIRTTGYTDDLQVPFDIQQQLAQHIKSINIDLDGILLAVNSYYDQVRFFENVLKKIKPKAVFFINMGTQMPLIHAARMLGIKAIELQHGVQQANTPIYKVWQYFISGDNYLSYPTHFGVWGEDEANYIRREFKGIIKPLVLGYSWLDHPLNKNPEKEELEILKTQVEKFPLVALVTMQNQDEFPMELIGLAKKYEEVVWMVRLHPKWNKIAVKNLPENIIFDQEVQTLTLNELLSISNLHVTRDSASVYEATYQGIKSYVYAKMGERAFNGLIKQSIVGNLQDLKKDLDWALSLSTDGDAISEQQMRERYFKFDKQRGKFALDNDRIGDELAKLID